MKNIEDINRESVKKILAKRKIPEFSAGDTIKVGVRIAEGKRERIQYSLIYSFKMTADNIYIFIQNFFA